MKKFRIILFLILAMALMACGTDETKVVEENGKKEKMSIVTTIFPQYDWNREILGERVNDVELILLQDTGADVHNYQPTAEDIAAIAESDLFIYLGGESDDWVEDALKHTDPDKTVALNLMKIQENQLLEEEPHDHDHDHHHEHEHDYDHDDHHHDDHSHNYDEHLWLLYVGRKFVKRHCGGFSQADSDYKDIYRTMQRII